MSRLVDGIAESQIKEGFCGTTRLPWNHPICIPKSAPAAPFRWLLLQHKEILDLPKWHRAVPYHQSSTWTKEPSSSYGGTGQPSTVPYIHKRIKPPNELAETFNNTQFEEHRSMALVVSAQVGELPPQPLLSCIASEGAGSGHQGRQDPRILRKIRKRLRGEEKEDKELFEVNLAK